MNRRFTTWLVTAAAGALALGSMSLATTTQAAPPDHANASAQARARHEQTVNFWTNDKVAKARTRDFVRGSAGTFTLRAQSAKPGKSKPGTSTGTTASWNGGGAVLRTTGKVLFAMGADYFVCSASVAKDNATDRTIILTAGHCVFDNEASAFATHWMFIPDYDSAAVNLDPSGTFCASTVYGCWTATSLVAAKGFTSQTSFNTRATLNDYAFAVVGAGGKTNAQLDSVVGAQAISFTTATAGASTYSFGYPAGSPYTGKDLTYSTSPLGRDSRNANRTYSIASTMTGGCSGGPWFQGFSTSTGTGTMMSVNSYSYGTTSTTMQGPLLNSTTAAMFQKAHTSSGNVAA